jgi:hypothetical protein
MSPAVRQADDIFSCSHSRRSELSLRSRLLTSLSSFPVMAQFRVQAFARKVASLETGFTELTRFITHFAGSKSWKSCTSCLLPRPLHRWRERRIVHVFPHSPQLFMLLTTKENNMLKRLTRKLITLSAVVVILGAVSFTPASSTNQQLYCYYDIVTAECPSGWVCCDDFTARNCWCS